MRTRNIFWGVLLVLAAVLIIASQLGSFVTIGVWSVLAAVLLAAALVQSLVRRNFVGAALSAALLYVIFQRPLNLFYISPWLLILAAVLLGAGLGMLFRKRPRAYSAYNASAYAGGAGGEGRHPATLTEEGDDDNHPVLRTSFGSASKYLHADRFEYGQFYASFGTLEVFFDQVTLAPGGAEVFVECSFGSIKLYVPRHWRVEASANASLGDILNDTRYAQTDENSPVLALNGNVSLASVEVQYI